MSRPNLRDHPKFKRLVETIGLPEVYVEAHLNSMWKPGYANGDPLLGDPVDVELCAEWKHSGRPAGEWFRAVLECRWIDEVTDDNAGNAGNALLRYQIHDLFDHAPDYVFGRKMKELERQKNKTCEHCGNAYKSETHHSRYCSNSCRQQHFKHKESEKGNAGNAGRRSGALPVTQGNATPIAHAHPLNTKSGQSNSYPTSHQKGSSSNGAHKEKIAAAAPLDGEAEKREILEAAGVIGKPIDEFARNPAVSVALVRRVCEDGKPRGKKGGALVLNLRAEIRREIENENEARQVEHREEEKQATWDAMSRKEKAGRIRKSFPEKLDAARRAADFPGGYDAFILAVKGGDERALEIEDEIFEKFRGKLLSGVF